jgi:hypothetical protein
MNFSYILSSFQILIRRTHRTERLGRRDPTPPSWKSAPGVIGKLSSLRLLYAGA